MSCSGLRCFRFLVGPRRPNPAADGRLFRPPRGAAIPAGPDRRPCLPKSFFLKSRFFSPVGVEPLSESRLPPLIAVDIGNSRMKLGFFSGLPATTALPSPAHSLRLSSVAPQTAELDRWFKTEPPAHDVLQWRIGSVCRPATTHLLEWIRAARPNDQVLLLSAEDVGLQVDLPHPDMVGIDRLLDAKGANALREPNRAALVVDVGTAVTVDYLDEKGIFHGGAILPGIGMSVRALHEFTDLLPLLQAEDLADPPPAIGRDTIAAMKSGLYWGTLGAIRELSDQMRGKSQIAPEIFLTGRSGRTVRRPARKRCAVCCRSDAGAVLR